MLHEVLLALSGHPSPLFVDGLKGGKTGQHDGSNESLPLLSSTEKALLSSIGRLSELHRRLRQHLESVVASHPSTICRAVANGIRQLHLARFQKKILDVESRILTKDATIVGAYDIVPLASVVGEFDDWHRRMEWYWHLSCFMTTPSDQRETDTINCSGAELIDRLRGEAKTGYSDIESAATELSRVAETAWLRQLSSWILHGKLPTLGESDFFVQRESTNDEQVETFRKMSNLLPKFVSSSSASSMLFIGKSIHQVRRYERQSSSRTAADGRSLQHVQLTSAHMRQLSTLSLPIVPVLLSRAISAIRLSLSQNVLQHLLSMEQTLMLLSCLRRYFLLDDGEFAVALITEADNKLQARQQSMGRLLQQDPVKALQGLSISNSELSQTLALTWKGLAARDHDEDNAVFEFARKHISLSTPSKVTSRPTTSDSVTATAVQVSPITFNDILFPSPSTISLATDAPFDLFLSARDVETYSALNAYLLSIRRAHLRLSDLWRRTAARRDHPAPPNPRFSSSESGRATLARTRQKNQRRLAASRKIWATCSAAIFLLAGIAAYFEGEIIECSWAQFSAWVGQSASSDTAEDSSLLSENDATGKPAQRDPETLAAGHRAFLASLTYALLLTDAPYTRDLRSLLGNVDQLIALFVRLLDVQQRLDTDTDAGLDCGHSEDDERRVALELDRARKRVDSDLKSVTMRLRQLDMERIGAGRYLDLGGAETGGFEPWKGGGVDRLMMKLEFGRMREDGYDIV